MLHRMFCVSAAAHQMQRHSPGVRSRDTDSAGGLFLRWVYEVLSLVILLLKYLEDVGIELTVQET